jgi:lauroyl/myristoyl acyltransferase
VNLIYLPLYPLFLFISWLSAFAPAWTGRAVAWLLGSLAYWLLPNRRRVMALNYAPVIGADPSDPRVQRIGRLAFRNYALYLYEFLKSPHYSVDAVDKRVSLHVGDDFAQARALGKGMIFASAHFGNMDYAGISVVKRIVPMTVVADVLKPKVLMDRLVEFRGKKGLNIVYLAKAPRAILTALKRNEAVGFLLDVGCARKDGVPVTFFGRRTMFTAGPALLSLRTGAPIVVGYARVEGDHIHAYSYPPIFAENTGNKEEDARRCSQAIATYFEDFIRRCPEQWYIFRPMWGPDNAEPATAEATSASERVTETA